eukprot:1072709-Prymnesium_polylepis.1
MRPWCGGVRKVPSSRHTGGASGAVERLFPLRNHVEKHIFGLRSSSRNSYYPRVQSRFFARRFRRSGRHVRAAFGRSEHTK